MLTEAKIVRFLDEETSGYGGSYYMFRASYLFRKFNGLFTNQHATVVLFCVNKDEMLFLTYYMGEFQIRERFKNSEIDSIKMRTSFMIVSYAIYIRLFDGRLIKVMAPRFAFGFERQLENVKMARELFGQEYVKFRQRGK